MVLHCKPKEVASEPTRGYEPGSQEVYGEAFKTTCNSFGQGKEV